MEEVRAEEALKVEVGQFPLEHSVLVTTVVPVILVKVLVVAGGATGLIVISVCLLFLECTVVLSFLIG